MKREQRGESLEMKKHPMRLHNVSRGMRIDLKQIASKGARSGATKYRNFFIYYGVAIHARQTQRLPRRVGALRARGHRAQHLSGRYQWLEV